MIFRNALLAVTLLAVSSSSSGQGARLLRHPSISATNIVFTYANDVWVVDREGGDARRLTSFQGSESNPHFSPEDDVPDRYSLNSIRS